ncbi:hypothetical protein [Microbulbifer halophilus]|uniref:MbtH domain protein n=1 Tax=Microbulbifer halophilus TaxID=453963 RepID=A0ABW5EEG0_9GAMM|nr:hypothetical protein [Microbulbifer halophilus]MCW8128220.1 hypothetical protein [Microbulbifer halophilus]
MSELVDFLSNGEHPVTMTRYTGGEELGERIERGYVLIKFADTRGGTELGLRIDPSESDLSEADFTAGQGQVRLVGNLTLDFVPVVVEVMVDLISLEGTGSLQRVQAQDTVEA